MAFFSQEDGINKENIVVAFFSQEDGYNKESVESFKVSNSGCALN